MSNLSKKILLGIGIPSIISLPLLSVTSCFSQEIKPTPPINGQFLGTILTKSDVYNLGWDIKTSISIDDWKTWAPNVIQIAENAFSNNQLTSLIIPNSVRIIRKLAFSNNLLTSLTIPDSVTSIGTSAFSNNQLTSLTIPNSVTIIEDAAFSDNKFISTSTINLPSQFDNSTERQRIGLPTLTWVVVDNLKITKYGQILGFYNLTNATKELIIKSSYNGITAISIGSSAFSNNQLTSLTIPNSVTSIWEYAFSNNQLNSLTIPNSVTSIGSVAFSKNKLTSLTIPDSVTTIGDSTFANNQLTSLTIPNSVTKIGNSAFANNQLTATSTIILPSEFDTPTERKRIGLPS